MTFYGIRTSTCCGRLVMLCCLSLTADIDECDRGIDECDANAECSDTIGNYECICRPGYDGDGFNCTSMFIPCRLYCYYSN